MEGTGKIFSGPVIQKRSFIVNRLIKGAILFIFILMFLYPYASFKGASSGLLLWFINVCPALLPFIILSNLMIRLNIADRISRFLYPVIGRLLRISPVGCYPVLVGFLSGLPMGAKATADLTSEGKILRYEGNFLMGMCNNASPIFILSYISISQLKLPHIRLPLFAIVYGSSILASIICRTFTGLRMRTCTPAAADDTVRQNIRMNYRPVRFSFDILDSSIMNGFEVITKIGGYIILFSILAQITNEIGPDTGLFKAVMIGALEITTGINQICRIPMNTNIKIVLAAVLTSFGGLSGIAQTKSVLGSSRLSLKYYLCVKLISAAIALVLSVIYIMVKGTV